MGQNTTIYYLNRNIEDVPGGDDWLHRTERRQLARYRFAKRRNDWRLSRWTGKCAVCALQKIPCTQDNLTRIVILAADDGAPEVLQNDLKSDLSISLSHSDGRGLCALGSQQAVVGCDVEAISERILTFIGDYLTDTERTAVASLSPDLQNIAATVIWSAKESALKAMREGLRLDTRSVDVQIADIADVAAWQPLAVSYLGGQRTFRGRWRVQNTFVETLLAESPDVEVVALQITL